MATPVRDTPFVEAIELRCPDPACHFAWHRVPLLPTGPGHHPVPHRCERNRCGRWWIVLFEVVAFPEPAVRLVAIRPRLGSGPIELRRSLNQFPELGAAEIDLAVAASLAALPRAS